MTSSTWVHYKTMRKKRGKCAVVKDFFFSIFNIFRYLLTYFLPITQLFSTNVARSIQCKKLHFSKEILAHYDCTLILTFSNHHNEKIIPALFSAPDEIQWSCSYLSILPLVFVNSSQVCIYYTIPILNGHYVWWYHDPMLGIWSFFFAGIIVCHFPPNYVELLLSLHLFLVR